MSVLTRNNVQIIGSGKPMVFAHGFGCDQNMWRYVWPAFESDHRIVLFDHVGAGHSDLSAYNPQKYSSLKGYADDLLEICHELDLENAIFVGHSVSSMIGAIAAIDDPTVFEALVMVGPSPRYIDDGEYHGGFSEEDISGLLTSLESNYLGWSAQMAPVIMANPDRPALGAELTESFCRTDPEIARQFASVTFMSDNRDDLEKIKIPTLILQCSSDAIAPEVVGKYVNSKIPNSTIVFMKATGHCPNLSAPEETIAAIREFLSSV